MKTGRLAVIIPARYGSSRLPGKPLSDICGLPMVVRVVQRASLIEGADIVAVATDDERIAKVVEEKGFDFVMTSIHHPSGTDRIAEAASLLGLSGKDVVVNVQGDQPLFDLNAIDKMVSLLMNESGFVMTTAACPMDERDAEDPNRVKVVLDDRGSALYFSRSLIPYDRDRILKNRRQPYLRHLGLYCYRVEFLRRFVNWPEGRLESIERLEQLRVLERGFEIGVVQVDSAPLEVDTREDLKKVRRLFEKA